MSVLAYGAVALCCQEKRIGISIPHPGFDFRLGLQQTLPADFIIENINGVAARVISGNESSQGVPEQAQHLGRIPDGNLEAVGTPRPRGASRR
jgi:hypothetical protein